MTHLRNDLFAGVSVFLVSVPLCMGVALASGAPVVAGMSSGIIGGILVGALSRSPVAISGPAAGLVPLVLGGIATLGSYRAFLTAVVLAGIGQLGLGYARAGTINRYFPAPVIRGMLTAIGLILIATQLAHFIGYDESPFGIETLRRPSVGILAALGGLHPGALLIGIASLAVLLLWDRLGKPRLPFVPGIVVAALVGIGANLAFARWLPALALDPAHHLATMPPLTRDVVAFPDLAALANPKTYVVAAGLALVASLETLLAIEAADRLDERGGFTPPSHELIAQGAGNLFAGILGALPMTAVLARTTVNIEAGARSRRAALTQGALLLLALLLFGKVINLLPLATLAAILLHVGVHLISAANLRQLWSRGFGQLMPYAVTVVAILYWNLLVGVCIGLMVAAAFILRSLHLGRGLAVTRHGRVTKIDFNEEVTFFHKVALARVLEELPGDSILEIDGSRAHSVDFDVLDLLVQFRRQSESRGIQMIVGGIEVMESYTPEQIAAIEAEYAVLLKNNRDWVDERTKDDPTYFARQAVGQNPSFLFIGCADSRVPAESITKTDPGKLFVHRNIANLVSPHDVNFLSVLQYSVEVLNVPHIIVCGHYGCGGVRAALTHRSLGLIDNWIQPIKQTVKNHQDELEGITDPVRRERRVIELHVLQQVHNLLKSPVVQRSINKLGTPRVHGWVYDLETGMINDLGASDVVRKDIFRFDFNTPVGH